MLRVEGLTRPGLGPIDLELAPGRCLAVTGPSGSGKTLFLRALADLDPNQGRVSLNGRLRDDMPATEWRRRVTYVATESGWWAETVGAHFKDWHGLGDIMEVLGLPDAGAWPVARLSTGERQRLALARALEHGPRVLLLDEPTSALDGAAAEAVEALLKARMASGLAVVLATHDLAQARRFGRDHLAFDGGRALSVQLEHYPVDRS